MERANMLILSKDVSEKDHSLKTQLLNKLLNSFNRSLIWKKKKKKIVGKLFDKN